MIFCGWGAEGSPHRNHREHRKFLTQDERWDIRFKEVMDFINTNHRNSYKYNMEERDLVNWLKASRKSLNAGVLKAERVEKFNQLLKLSEQYKRKNQYE